MLSIDLDSSDLVLLGRLQADAREKLESLAAETGLSVPTVQRRLRRMREAGIIEAETVRLSPEALGFPMTFLVLVELERERLDHLDAFRRKARAEPRIQQCYYITGEADFALIVLARDVQDFEALTRRVFFDDPNIKRFRTSVAMDRTKVGLAVPIDG
ncbi:MAG: Lrp/AsnC family transcriptional regulator [Pseudomonadota bacterium]